MSGSICDTCANNCTRNNDSGVLDSREQLKAAMRNVIRDALLNFDESEFVDYELDVYVDEYLARAMRLLDGLSCLNNMNNKIIKELEAERDKLIAELESYRPEKMQHYFN